MAIDPRFIRSDSSIGIETNARQKEIERANRLHSGGRSADDVVQKVRQFQASQTPASPLRFPQDTPKYYMMMEIGTYGRNNPLTVTMSDLKTIILPMPKEIVDKNEVDYEEKELGLILGGLWNNGSQVSVNLQDQAKALGDLGSRFLESMGSDLGSAANTALGSLAALTPDSGLGRVARAYLGLSPNQWLTVLLKGPKYKRYHYTWTLAPKNFEEAQTVNKIVKTIQNAKCPELHSSGFVFMFPSIFKLYFKVEDKDHKYLFKFKPSVMEQCSVEYMNTFYHGENGENPPESVKLHCAFLELEFWLKNDYLD